MHRRHFIQVTSACLLVPLAASERCLAATSEHADLVFFDGRFPGARQQVARWDPAEAAIAVYSDVTPFWSDALARQLSAAPLRIGGATTASFLFCLRVLAEDHSRVDLAASRVDRNLFTWTLSTLPKPMTERHNG